MLAPWKKSYDKPRQHIKKQRRYFANKCLSSQSCGFPSSHVWMWELDSKESWALKNWCFELWCWRRLLRVPWTARRSNQSLLKEIKPEYSLEGLMLKLKLLILWPPDVKNWLIGKDPDAGKDRRQEEKGTKKDEIVGRHHQLNGHDFERDHITVTSWPAYRFLRSVTKKTRPWRDEAIINSKEGKKHSRENIFGDIT